ncbi:MAG: tripartite tricarboxylate transporter substrate binding protein [Burkholderiaceae bacterium]
MRTVRPSTVPASARTVSATPGGVSLAGAPPASTPRRRLLAGVASATALALPPALAGLATRPARAQDAFPTKPLRCVVAFPAGGVLDLTTRVVSEKLAAALGQPVIVENRPGASGNIGTESVLRAPADGYTLMGCSPYLAINPLMMASTKWKSSDFAGVGLIGAPPNVFVVPASLPATTLREFIDYAKARPGALTVTNPSIGSSNHLGQELLFSIAGFEMPNVMYKSQAEMLPDVVNGQVALSLVTLALALPFLREGRLKALAISAPRRSPELPDVPTIAEAGYADAMFLPWFGVAIAAATPRPLVRRLSDELQKVLAQPDTVARLEKMGALLTPAPAEEFDRLIASERERWAKVIRARNIKPV